MTTVKLYYCGKTLTGIESRGHSGFSSKGRDIVCAAVSALMQALVLGLEGREGFECLIDDRVPVIRASWPSSEQERLAILTETIAESLRVIAQENPRYVKLSTEEK